MATKKWNDAHKEHRYAYNRSWYHRNKDRVKSLAKIWKKNNPDKVAQVNKNSRLKQRYNISLEIFNQMLTSQDNKCAICGKNFKNKKDTCIDHDHNTGRIRQLLCCSCNLGIGNFQDSIVLVEKARDYLVKWS